MPLRSRQATFELVLRTPFRLSRGASETRRNVFIALEDGDCAGLGEAAPIARYGESAESAVEALRTMAGRCEDPGDLAGESDRIAVPGQRAAQAAFDMALHDLAARRAGCSVRRLLGIADRPLPPTSWTIGLDPIPEALAKVEAAGDFEVLKLKMGGEGDMDLLRAVAGAARQTIRVDANEGWTLAQARERLAELARLGVEFVEQPLPAGRLEETRALRRSSPLPLVADEDVHRAEDVPALVGAFDGINVKLMKCGGIAPALRLIAAARAHHMKILLGCMIESSLGISAALALAPLVDWIDLDGHLLTANDPFAGIALRSGRLAAPAGLGLGVTMERDVFSV